MELEILQESSNSTDPGTEILEMESPLDYPSVKILLVVIYVIVFIACFFGNLLVIVVIALHRRMRTVTNFFLANLAATDLCVAVFCVIPNMISYLFSAKWFLGKVMCKLQYFVQAMSSSASISILAVISLERYVAIIYPMRSKQLQTICLLRLTVIILWTISASSGIPFLFFYSAVPIPTISQIDGISVTYMYYCMQESYYNQSLYHIISFLLWYLLPLLMLLVVYTRISVVLWKTSRVEGSAVCGGGRRSTVGHRAALKKEGGSSIIPLKLGGSQSKSSRGGYAALNRYMVSGGNDVTVGVTTEVSVACDEDTDLGTKTSQKVVASPKKWCTSDARSQTDSHSGVSQPMVSMRSSFKNSKSSSGNSGSCSTAGYTCTAGGGGKVENALVARRKVIRLLISVCVCFAVCMLPYNVRMLLLAIKADDHSFGFWHQLFPPFTFIMYYLNSALNPLLYAFLSDKFRTSLVELFKCRGAKRQGRNSMTMRTINSVA